MPVYILSDNITFPPVHLAEEEGLLAIGGDLSRKRLLHAYSQGIFPWYAQGEPILWWSPDPRLVLFPSEIKISRSLNKILRRQIFHVTMDTAFEQVITACAHVRKMNNEGTWLVDEMIQAYCELHRAGYAHSVEAWCEDGSLAGGLYGVSLGRCFFGESMFMRKSNASKVALVGLTRYLAKREFQLIDCQVTTNHMQSLGAREISRRKFLSYLDEALQAPTLVGSWKMES